MMLTVHRTIALPGRVVGEFRRAPLVCLGLLVCLVGQSLAARAASGQLKMVGAVDAAEESGPPRSFVLPTQKSEVTDDLADFARHSKKSAWDRAFKSLQKVLDANPQGLMPREDGLMVPSRLLIRKSLIDLPADGKDAFRIFHDPEAKQLVAEAQALPAGSPEEIAKLQKVYQHYFVASAGDQAADRLGDIYFEQGNFVQAAECWRLLLAHHPESALPRAQILVKLAVAAARLGRWDEIRDIQSQIAQRHAADPVIAGGKQSSAAEFIAGLLATADAAANAPVVLDAKLPPDLALPKSNEPAWQFRMLTPTDAAMIANIGQNWGWGYSFTISQMVPLAVADTSRVYVNLMGYHLAVDIKTGKLLWRSTRFHEMAQKAQQNPQMSSIEQYGLTLAGDFLYSVYRDPNQAGQPMPFRLAKIEAATGKEVWNTSTIPELQQWSMMGSPTVAGDRVLLGAIDPQKGTEQQVVAIGVADGKPFWKSLVGTHQVDPNQSYGRRTSQLAIVTARDKAYVETHAGALLQLDIKTGAIDWAFQYESESLQNGFGGRIFWGGDSPTHVPTTAAAPLISNGVLYLKGMRSQRLFAIELGGPSVLWQRPIDKGAMVVGVDAERLYLGGKELMAVDLKSKGLKWAAQSNFGSDFSRPLLTENRLFQFSPRGIFEFDTSNGNPVDHGNAKEKEKVFRGADLQSYGGNILVAPDMLLTVSNMSISAYRLGGEASQPAPAAATGAATEAAKPETAEAPGGAKP